jgi:non-ribosomal peptide synthetase component F
MSSLCALPEISSKISILLSDDSYLQRTAIVEEDSQRSVTYASLKSYAINGGKVLNNSVHCTSVMITGVETPLICILTDRGICSIVAMLSILSVGGAYVPIGPNFPKDRQLYILTFSMPVGDC